MSIKLSQVGSASGSPMGRSERHDIITSDSPKFSLKRIPINRGGYDSGGAYWGIGQPLYWYSDDDGNVSAYFRAADREAAKAHIRKTYPTARFFR